MMEVIEKTEGEYPIPEHEVRLSGLLILQNGFTSSYSTGHTLDATTSIPNGLIVRDPGHGHVFRPEP